MCNAEPLAGTATESIDYWLAVERGGSWGPKIPKDVTPTFSGSELARIDSTLATRPRARLQLLRPTTPSDRIRVIVARAGVDGWLAVRELVDLAALPSDDLEAWRPSNTVSPPFYLVCTHGKRDRCCSQLGQAAYKTLAELGGQRVFQTSHLGGHRFAPVILVLPHGYLYGRIPAERCGEIFASHEIGEVGPLEFLRGRVDLGGPAQFSEIHLRGESGENRLAAVEYVGERAIASHHWEVVWLVRGRRCEVEVVEDVDCLRVLKSCGDDGPAPVGQYRVVAQRLG